MNFLRNWWKERNPKEKRILKIGFIAVAGFLVVQVVIKPFFAWNSQLKEEIEFTRTKLDKYQKIINRKSDIQDQSRILQSNLNQISRGLLPFEKPELASAELQKILKKLGSKSELTFQKITPEDPKESNKKTYSLVSLSFPLSCDITELEKFLIDLKSYQKILQISEFRVRVVSRSREKMTVQMVVSGFIKNIKETEPEDSLTSGEGGI